MYDSQCVCPQEVIKAVHGYELKIFPIDNSV